MLPLIHDPNVLRNPCALNSLCACRNSYSPYQTNADDPPLYGCLELCDHPSRCL